MNAELPVRGFDSHGSGAYMAPRGDHFHRGVDLACYKGTKIKAECAGRVTKIGYPYSQGIPDPAWSDNRIAKFLRKKALRYVQVTDYMGVEYRYFYINPLVKLDDTVNYGDILGESQGLIDIYPGIIDHIHYEMRADGHYLDPIGV